MDAFVLLGIHFRPRRMVAFHDHRPFLAPWRDVVLIVGCQFGIWQDALGQDEFLCDGTSSEQPTHLSEV